MVSGIGRLALGIYSAIEIQAIKSAQAELRDHVKNLQSRVESDNQEMVELERNTKKLYEYTYSQFVLIGDKLNTIECDLEDC